MSLRNKFLGAAVAAVAFGGMAVSSANAGIVFLSTTSVPNAQTVSNPSVEIVEGSSTTLYIFMRPTDSTSAERFTGVSLSADVSTAGIVGATAQSVINASNEDTDPRWSGLNNATLGGGPNSLFSNTNAVAVGGGAYGIRLGTISSTDTQRVGNDFLYGSVTISGLAVGQTDIFLKVGNLAIANAAGTPATIFFGAGDASVSGSQLGAVSTLADATITVTPIPEPASLGLLALGGLGMLRRRRA